jgi:hypothetical protein
MDFDPRDFNEARDIDRQSIYGLSRGEDERERHESDARDPDPGDAFVRRVDLPRGLERELVQDSRERLCELNGDDSRMLATIGAFRVVSEREFDAFRGAGEGLEHLRKEELIRSVPIGHDEEAVVLTDRGWDVLDGHRLDRDGAERQEFHAGVSRPRELRHDAQLFGAYREVEKRLREKGAQIERVVLEVDLKREYQQFLQEHNRNLADSDGRPDRDEQEIATWAREHDLPYFDDQVHFPDFRIEYELDGRDRHEDVEVVTDNYRGAHAASRIRAGFTCVSSSKRGGAPFSPREWDWL